MRRPRIPGRLPSLGGSATHYARVRLELADSIGASNAITRDQAAEARRAVAAGFATGLEPARTVLERQIRERAVSAARAAARGQPDSTIERDLDFLIRTYTRENR